MRSLKITEINVTSLKIFNLNQRDTHEIHTIITTEGEK